MIIDAATDVAIKQQAIEEGMKTLRKSGIQEVLNGQTTLEELLRLVDMRTGVELNVFEVFEIAERIERDGASRPLIVKRSSIFLALKLGLIGFVLRKSPDGLIFIILC